MRARLKNKSTPAAALLAVLLCLSSCSDDRPVGDSFKDAKSVETLISAMYDPAGRDRAAARLGPLSCFIPKRLEKEVADQSKNTPDALIAREMMLEMLGRLDNERDIDGILIQITRDSAYPRKLRHAADGIARARLSRRGETDRP